MELKWSNLTLLTTENINKLNVISGIFRISEKESDNKYYVIFVGSASDLKAKLTELLSEASTNQDLSDYLKRNGREFAFKYAPIEDAELRKAAEKQLFRQYVPKYNSEEPTSSMEPIKINFF